jgi:hypothetical protein
MNNFYRLFLGFFVVILASILTSCSTLNIAQTPSVPINQQLGTWRDFPMPSTEFKAVGQYKALVIVDGERLGYRVFNVSL